MKRSWVIYDVFLGQHVLVARCRTKDEASRIAALRKIPSGGSRVVLEQLDPGDMPSHSGSRGIFRRAIVIGSAGLISEAGCSASRI